MSVDKSRCFIYQSGFTLIELMISIAIIGILVSIGVVSYQTQVRKAHFITIYQEINQFRHPYQILINEGAGVIAFNPSGLNVPYQTKYCQFSVVAPVRDSATQNAIICAIQNLPYLKSQTLSLDYIADGKWECKASAGIKAAYLPQACQ